MNFKPGDRLIAVDQKWYDLVNAAEVTYMGDNWMDGAVRGSSQVHLAGLKYSVGGGEEDTHFVIFDWLESFMLLEDYENLLEETSNDLVALHDRVALL